ncbi:MAG: FliM/FliN family flagellar motor switch protein [Planctomycetota bacterium]|nr:FliM/FliN family flagellar motor switch protein [Planctomycetota bacterium]
MNEILSNDEIDTLVDLFRSNGAIEDDHGGFHAPAETVDAPVERRVNQMDLLKPNRLSREQLRGLNCLFESAGKLLSATISDKLRIDTRCECVAVEQQRFSTWLEHLPGPVAIYVVKMKPFPLPVLVTVSTGLLYGAVDRILGGSGRVARVPRDFTQAEYTVADALVGPCVQRIAESLSDVVELEWEFENRFCNPSMAQILPSQDVVLSAYFQASGEFLIGDLRLLIPFVSLEPYLEKLGKDNVSQAEPGAMQDLVQHAVKGVPMDLSAVLGDAKINLEQLMALQPGDVVPLTTRAGAPAVVPVQGEPKFRGHLGRIGNRLALQIADVIDN